MTDEFSDPSTPFDWRFDRTIGASTIADLGSHLIDLALWMVGDVERVNAQSAIFTRQRATPQGPRPVTVEDVSSVLVRFTSGAVGTLEVTRAAVRQPCDLTLQVNGSHGTLRFDYAHLNELRFGSDLDEPDLYGMRTIRAEHHTHPYATHWWPIGQGVGYGSSFVNQASELLNAWPDGPWSPDFRHGARVQAICEAAERSSQRGEWVMVSEVVDHLDPATTNTT